MRTTPQRAFTLVELLVVIGIIGIIIAVLLPSVSAVTRTSKKLQTQATFNAIDAGLETYRNATGEDYPPSGSDGPLGNAVTNSWIDATVVANPYREQAGGSNVVMVTGANMLVYALAGADLLGTPGFKDLNRDAKRRYADDTHDGAGGLYELDDNRQAVQRRFGPFVDLEKVDIASMQDYCEDTLVPKGKCDQNIPIPPFNLGSAEDFLPQRFILDGFGYPILYYKANVGAPRMVTDWTQNPPSRGIYEPGHNGLYTGYEHPGMPSHVGMDLGAGTDHRLRNGLPVSPDPGVDNLNDPSFQNFGLFARFIWDRDIEARNEPVRKDSYLLISPGHDALWGTEDDITNFEN